MATAWRFYAGVLWRCEYTALREPTADLDGKARIDRLETVGGNLEVPETWGRDNPGGFSLGFQAVGEKVSRLHAGTMHPDHGLLDWRQPVRTYEVANPMPLGDYPGMARGGTLATNGVD